MPVLGQRKKTKIVLPASTRANNGEECWVECFEDPTVGDYVGQNTSDQFQATAMLLTRLIVDWNFTDQSGSKVPVTSDNVSQLPIEDMAVIGSSLQLEKKLNQNNLSAAKKNN